MLWIASGCSVRYPFVRKILPSRIFPRFTYCIMKFLVENAKEFADIFLFLFFNDCHLCYRDLKVKGISWASCSCRKQNIQPQMAEMIRQFSGLYKSKGQNNWLQVLLVEGLQLYHKHFVPSVYFSGPPLQRWLRPGAVSLLMVTR